jgi:uncharacterized membrane protein YkoI
MNHSKWILLGFVVMLSLGLVLSTGCAKKEAGEQGEMSEEEEAQPAVPQTELPDAVLVAIEANAPDAEIGSVEVTEEEGIKLYDIEFQADKGEIEVAENGIVIDLTTIIALEDLPPAAAQAIQTAAEGATIERVEKSEVRSEIKKEGEQGVIVSLDPPRYVYEAELVKDDQRGEIAVDADGNIVEALKWQTKEAEEKE